MQPFVSYAPSTENEQGHECIRVVVRTAQGLADGMFELNETYGDEVELTLSFAGQSHTAQAPTFFEALNDIRAVLEKQGAYPMCNGSCENVYPSAMQLSMGVGRLAYTLTMGRPAKAGDVVDLFAANAAGRPAGPQAQKQFYEAWLQSLSGKGAAIPHSDAALPRKSGAKKIRVGPTFRLLLLLAGPALWMCIGLYRWLTKDAGSEVVWYVLAVLGLAVMAIAFLPIFETGRPPAGGRAAARPRNPQKACPLEEQLHALSLLGIRPKQADFVQWVCTEWGREALEAAPYTLLLHALGGARPLAAGAEEPLSDDVFALDAECVEGGDSYAAVCRRLAALSKGAFGVSNLASAVDPAQQSASVSFSLGEEAYCWPLAYDGDWFDAALIGKINRLLQNKGSKKLFYVCSPDQTMTIVFATAETVAQLNALVGTPFVLSVSKAG